MTPLHPLAAVAAGTMLGLAALTAPNTVPTRGLDLLSACSVDCGDTAGSVPQVGAVVPPDQVHLIVRPGRYGLGEPPEGERYGIVTGHLVRLDDAGGQVRSVLRPAPQILD